MTDSAITPPVEYTPCMTPIDLRCHFGGTGIVIDDPCPLLSWRLEPAGMGGMEGMGGMGGMGGRGSVGGGQVAYQILVGVTDDQANNLANDYASDLARDLTHDRLLNGQNLLWDSGRVASTRSVNVAYAGPALSSRQSYVWQVRVWDDAGRVSSYSELSHFEMGLLQPEDWVAKWIGWPAGEPGKAAYFRVHFDLPETFDHARDRARLYITGLGYYESYVNGQRLGDTVLEPAYTDVTKRVLYNVHDVTTALKPGPNVLAATVGIGWYGLPALMAQLEVRDATGWRVVVATTRRPDMPVWLVANGPVTFNSVFDGEHYDARLERPGWTTTSYDPACEVQRLAKWKQACQVHSPTGRLRVTNLEPIRVVKELAPQLVREVQPGIYVVDFGQNHAGWCRLRTCGPAGQAITLRYAESLNDDGTVNQENLRSADATDCYIMRGGEEETWEPRFTYHGYRYVQIEGWPGKLGASHSGGNGNGDLVSCVVRSDLPFRGTFTCDNPLLNRIHQLVRWTEESNLHGIPTDCPQRDERMGWLNDMAARSEELVYNFDTARFLRKFVDDIADAQDDRGALTDTVPFHWGYQPADPISVCYLLIPYLLHQHDRGTQVLRKHYAGFCAWVQFLRTQAQDDIVAYSHYGDWAPPAAMSVSTDGISAPLSKETPAALISTAYYCYAARLLSRIAQRLGEVNDADTYGQLSQQIAASFHQTFWNDDVGGYGSGNQACNSLALYLDLVPGSMRDGVVAALVKNVRDHDHHVTTGNLCTKYLLEVLAHEHHFDTAFRLATQTTYPSWGFMLENGATTLWERWEHLVGGGMNSHNHPMLGSVGAWLYRGVAGLCVADTLGDSPVFEIRVPATRLLSHAQATLNTMWGQASSSWQRDGDRLTVSVDIPWNCTGTLHAAGQRHDLTCGHHEFQWEEHLPPTPPLTPHTRTPA